MTEVEKPTPRGVVVSPDGTRSRPGGATAAIGGGTARPGIGPEAPSLPAGPVATPAAPSSVRSSQVQVAVVPLGVVEYNGQTLPVSSPDGRFLAVQTGTIPPWDVLLAQDGVEVQGSWRVSIVSLEGAGKGGIAPVPGAEQLPAGLVLGRDADDAGVLVESPRADGSRWIGRVAWASGALEWLVQGRDVAAHAAIVPATGTGRAGLVFTRRAVGSVRSELVLRVREGGEAVVGGESGLTFAFPSASADGSSIAVIVIRADSRGAESVTLDVYGVGGSPDAPALVGPIASRPLRGQLPQGGMESAYLMMAPLQPGAWIGPDASGKTAGEPTFFFVHPQQGRAAVYEPAQDRVRLLARGSVAAVRWREPSISGDYTSHAEGRAGWFSTTPRGLVYIDDAGLERGVEPARVLAPPYVPRMITVGEHAGQMILLGPARGAATRLEVVRMRVGEP